MRPFLDIGESPSAITTELLVLTHVFIYTYIQNIHTHIFFLFPLQALFPPLGGHRFAWEVLSLLVFFSLSFLNQQLIPF